jgi:hypothetical protein
MTGDVLGEIVGITRIQPTPKSFRVDTIDVVTVQTVEKSSHGAMTAREIGSSTAARDDRSDVRKAVGGVAGPGAAHSDQERSKDSSTSISNTLGMRHVCRGVWCV